MRPVQEYAELKLLARGASFCRQTPRHIPEQRFICSENVRRGEGESQGENQWGFEVSLHEWFLTCPCRTDDPFEASSHRKIVTRQQPWSAAWLFCDMRG